MQEVMILTLRFDKNLGIGVIQGEVTLNCEEKKRTIKQCVFVFRKTRLASVIKVTVQQFATHAKLKM